MRCLVIGIGCWLLASTAAGQLTVSLNEDSKFVLGGTETGLLGIEFVSRDERGLIPSPDNDAGPFSFLLSNEPSRITFGTLNKNLNIDGEIVLPAGLKQDTRDITIQYGTIDIRAYLEKTQDDPPAWMWARVAEKLVDDIRIEVWPTFFGSTLKDNQIGVNYKEGPGFGKSISVGSIDWADRFSFDGSVGRFELDGDIVELHPDAQVILPDGWELTEFIEEHESCPPDLTSDAITIGLDSEEFASTFVEDGSSVLLADDLTGDQELVCTQWTEAAFLITAPGEDGFISAPEPASALLLATLFPFAFVLRNRR